MSFEDFIKDPYDESDNNDSAFTMVAKAIVLPAFQGWNNSQPEIFPYDGGKSGKATALKSCQEYCGEGDRPQQGLLTVVYADDVPSHPNGRLDDDWNDFVPVYRSKEVFSKADEIEGELPYDLVLRGLLENKTVFNIKQWCLISQEIDNFRKSDLFKGAKTTKKGYPHRVMVIKKVFETKEEAYSSVATEEEEVFFDANGDAGLQPSTIVNYTVIELCSSLEAIRKVIADAQKGIRTPDNKHLSKEAAREHACKTYAIQLSDLVLIEKLEEASLEDVPF